MSQKILQLLGALILLCLWVWGVNFLLAGILPAIVLKIIEVVAVVVFVLFVGRIFQLWT